MAKKIKKNEEDLLIVNLGEELEKSKPYLDKFSKAKSFNSERYDAYAENMAFYQGNQHLLKKYKNNTPWVVNMNTPYATVAIDNRVSSLLANDYIGELLPLSPDDVETIDALSKLYKKEWERMNVDNVIRESIRLSAVVREAYCHIVLDKDKIIGGNGNKRLGALEAYLIEPACIAIDPTARNLKNARYMFVTGRISKEEAIEMYPKLKSAQNSGDTFTPQDRGEVYYDNDYTTEQSDVFTVITYYGKNSQKRIDKVKMVNGIIVEEKVGEKGMKLRNFPVLQMRWKKAAQSCYGLSLMDEVLSLQKAITSIESAVTNTALAYAAPSMMVRKGCGVDPKVVAKANGAPGVVYAVEGNLDNAIRPVIPPKIEQSIINIKADFQEQIDKITGNSNQFLGDIGTSGNTAGGARVAVERAKIIEIDILNNISEFVSDITEVIIDYITQIYAGEKLTAYDGRDGKGTPKFTNIQVPEKSAIEGAQYKYYIELENKTPYSRERQKELLLEIYQLERQYDTPIKTVTVGDIIKNTDLENKDEIIERFNTLNFQDATTKAETIEELYTIGLENGVDQGLLTQAIAEIIGSTPETPAVDEVMAILEQNFQKQIQMNQQNLNNAVDTLMATPQSIAEVEQMAGQIEGGNMAVPQAEQPQITPDMLGI
jgi:hypothetical protein